MFILRLPQAAWGMFVHESPLPITDIQVLFKLECISWNTDLVHSDSTESLPAVQSGTVALG